MEAKPSLLLVEDMPMPAVLKTYHKYGVTWEGSSQIDSQLANANALKLWGRVNAYPHMKARRGQDYYYIMTHDKSEFSYGNAEPNMPAAIQGALKYNNVAPSLTQVQLDALVEAKEWTKIVFKEVFDRSEYLPFDAVVDQLVGNTSCGYPYNRHYANKKEFLEDGGERVLREFDDNLLSLPVPCVIWESALKEELRTNEKLDSNSIRQINAAPVTFTVSMNRYTLAQNEAMYDLHTTSPSGVGLSIFRGGWDRVYRKLEKHENGFVGDFKKYDSRLLSVLMKSQAECRWEGLDKKFRKEGLTATERNIHCERFWKLVDEEICSLLKLPNGWLVQKFCGNPSGTPNTVNNNTFCLFMLMAWCWIVKTGGTLHEFMLLVAMILYGDDNTFTIAIEALSHYNGTVIADFCTSVGMELIINSEPLKPIELEFLSMGFAKTPSGMVVVKPLKVDKFRAGLALRDDGKPSTRLQRLNSYICLFYGVHLAEPHSEQAEFYQHLIVARDELIKQWERLLYADEFWISAKCSIMTDQQLYSLHAGTECECEMQPVREMFSTLRNDMDHGECFDFDGDARFKMNHEQSGFWKREEATKDTMADCSTARKSRREERDFSCRGSRSS